MPIQSQNPMMNNAQMRLETLPHSESQVHPEFTHYRLPEFLPMEDTIATFEPTVTVLSMSLQWERLLAHEKRRNRTLTFWLSSLQEQLVQADSRYKALKEEYNSLCVNGNSQPGWAPQDARMIATSSPGSEHSPTTKVSNSMPPPPLPSREEAQGKKRNGDSMEAFGFSKRITTRNVALSPIDRQLSPKSRFSPSTPTSMNF